MTESSELMAVVRRLPCLPCLSRKQSLTQEDLDAIIAIQTDIDSCISVSDPDHVTTRGAGGEDTADNLFPACRVHHQERHQKGWKHMIRKYAIVKHWMQLAKRFDILESAAIELDEPS